MHVSAHAIDACQSAPCAAKENAAADVGKARMSRGGPKDDFGGSAGAVGSRFGAAGLRRPSLHARASFGGARVVPGNLNTRSIWFLNAWCLHKTRVLCRRPMILPRDRVLCKRPMILPRHEASFTVIRNRAAL